MNVGDDYWPAPLEYIAAENPTATKQVVVAEISIPFGPKSYRHLYTALAPFDRVEELLARRGEGGVGHEVSTSGPHPAPSQGTFDYEPKFWIWDGEALPDGLEPLVVGWRAGTRSVLIPDQGFLMTYGLVPRVVQSDTGGSVHWDDLSEPQYNVVIAQMVSELYCLELKQAARITIDREYLEDYAKVRNCSLIQVYYARSQAPLEPRDRDVLDRSDDWEFKLTIDPQICHGKPTIRGLRYPVETILELLSSGMTTEEILADYEDLEREDCLSVLPFSKNK